MSEKIAESAEHEPVHPSHLIFDLDRSFDWPGTANSRAGRNLYNVIDWTGGYRGQIALTPGEARALNPLGTGLSLGAAQ